MFDELLGSNGHPVNPLKKSKKKTRKRKKATSKKVQLSKDVNLWESKDFISYFLRQYEKKFGYSCSQVVPFQMAVINNIIKRIRNSEYRHFNNGLLKKYIDWFIKRDSDDIINSRMCPAENVFGMWNLMGSEVSWKKFHKDVMSKVIAFKEYANIPSIEEEDNFLLDQLDYGVSLESIEESLTGFGIPLAATYLSKKHNDADIANEIEKCLKLMSKDGFAKVVGQSLARAPYPEWFVLMDWQDKFKDVVGGLGDEPYPMNGIYDKKYEALK